MTSTQGGGVARSPVIAFSTDDVPAEHGFEAWRDLMKASHDVAAPAVGFRATLRTSHLGPMLLHEITTSGQSVERSSRRIRGDGLEHILLQINTVPMRGKSGDRVIDVPAGAVIVSALSRPLARQRVADAEALVVSLSRDCVAEFLPDPEAFHGAVLGQGIGHVLRDHIRSVAREVGRLQRDSASELARSTALMLAAALKSEHRNLGEARGALDGVALFRARRFIESHLGSPSLTPATVALAVGVSERTLFRLFAPSGGVASTIRARRLQAARSALTHPIGRRRIDEIARACGFHDPAHFSRSIRTAFGLSPRELIEDAIASHDTWEPMTGNDYRLWVKALG